MRFTSTSTKSKKVRVPDRDALRVRAVARRLTGQRITHGMSSDPAIGPIESVLVVAPVALGAADLSVLTAQVHDISTVVGLFHDACA
jgi:hypothetical protein